MSTDGRIGLWSSESLEGGAGAEIVKAKKYEDLEPRCR